MSAEKQILSLTHAFANNKASESYLESQLKPLLARTQEKLFFLTVAEQILLEKEPGLRVSDLSTINKSLLKSTYRFFSSIDYIVSEFKLPPNLIVSVAPVFSILMCKDEDRPNLLTTLTSLPPLSPPPPPTFPPFNLSVASALNALGAPEHILPILETRPVYAVQLVLLFNTQPQARHQYPAAYKCVSNSANIGRLLDAATRQTTANIREMTALVLAMQLVATELSGTVGFTLRKQASVVDKLDVSLDDMEIDDGDVLAAITVLTQSYSTSIPALPSLELVKLTAQIHALTSYADSVASDQSPATTVWQVFAATTVGAPTPVQAAEKLADAIHAMQNMDGADGVVMRGYSLIMDMWFASELKKGAARHTKILEHVSKNNFNQILFQLSLPRMLATSLPILCQTIAKIVDYETLVTLIIFTIHNGVINVNGTVTTARVAHKAVSHLIDILFMRVEADGIRGVVKLLNALAGELGGVDTKNELVTNDLVKTAEFIQWIRYTMLNICKPADYYIMSNTTSGDMRTTIQTASEQTLAQKMVRTGMGRRIAAEPAFSWKDYFGRLMNTLIKVARKPDSNPHDSDMVNDLQSDAASIVEVFEPLHTVDAAYQYAKSHTDLSYAVEMLSSLEQADARRLLLDMFKGYNPNIRNCNFTVRTGVILGIMHRSPSVRADIANMLSGLMMRFASAPGVVATVVTFDRTGGSLDARGRILFTRISRVKLQSKVLEETDDNIDWLNPFLNADAIAELLEVKEVVAEAGAARPAPEDANDDEN